MDNEIDMTFNDMIEANYYEEVLPETLEKDFTSIIRKRGEEYYDDDNVLEVYKNKNKYMAKVLGSATKPYNVKISIEDEYNAKYECDCPCDYPCKHEYAVLIAISNQEYKEVELKDYIKEKEPKLKSIIEKIPADELKNYLMSTDNDYITLNIYNLEESFRRYFPKQKYDYYYNNLYNAMKIDDDYQYKIDNYIEKAKQYLLGNDFEEVFKIIESIVEAYNDTGKLNYDDYVFDVVNKISMLLRIAYRKSNLQIKTIIEKWIQKLVYNNYYNNYFLEDLVLSIK